MFDGLESLFRERRPHRDPDLTLGDVIGSLLGVSARDLSQLVNSRFGVNFPAFMNQLRVREAALLLVGVGDKPIKVVMFESGFKSKSVFNREFQRYLGVSPTEFRKNGGSKGADSRLDPFPPKQSELSASQTGEIQPDISAARLHGMTKLDTRTFSPTLTP